MYLKKSTSNGKIYLSFVQGYRENGKVKQKTIEKLGYLEDLEKIYPDPISHFKELAAQKTLMMPKDPVIEIDTAIRLTDGANDRKNLGYAVVKRAYSMLDINNFFQSKQRTIPVKYNLNQIFSMLVYNRFIDPASKKGAYEKRGLYFEKYDFSIDDIYRSLDYFSQYSNNLQSHLHTKTKELIGRDSQLGYYDVTNFYYEIPYPDEDEYDGNNKLIKKGTRKKGPSKEHRKDPIVQMGLLMDTNGIPMAYNMFSGGKSEKESLLPTIRRVKKDYGMKRIIVVADRGLNTSDNTAYISGINDDSYRGHDGYYSIVTSEKDMTDKQMRDTYKGLWEIEESFRIIKGTFNTKRRSPDFFAYLCYSWYHL